MKHLPIGIMQGRLLPPESGLIQCFPAAGWRDEFALARAAGLACIEWIYEHPNEDENPLRTDQGVAEMRRLIDATGVAVWSICADYYMTKRLIDANGHPVKEMVSHLLWLIERARLLKITYIVLPFVDSSSLRSNQEKAALLPLLRQIVDAARTAGVELHLETDISPSELAQIFSEVSDPILKANYDIGNSASLGFDCREELHAIAPWLGSVHVKDRRRGGGTVPLGQGNADLGSAFRGLQDAGFTRWFIMQIARDVPGNEVAWAVSNRRIIEQHLSLLEGA